MITEQQKTEIVEQLKQGKVVVEFKKLNGDYRKMHCTLQEGVVPTANKADPLSQKKVRAVNPEVCSVWDTNAQGWRSFRWENVINATAEDLNEQKDM